MRERHAVNFLVLIPARNEAANLPRVIDELRRSRPDAAILVVDDASDDDTRDVLPTLGVHWLRLAQRLGIGGAMRAGLRYAQVLGHDVVVRVDGDGQHRPDQIGRLLHPIREDGADAVQGSRYTDDVGYASQGMRRLGQRILAVVLSLGTADRVTDPTSGFWAFGQRAVRILADHHPTGYPEPELRLFLRRNRLRVAEAPVQMRGRLAGRSSLTVPRAWLAAARVVLAMVVVPLRAVVEASARD
jgi:glycosyltransferase involved in cell wall biosynthesis